MQGRAGGGGRQTAVGRVTLAGVWQRGRLLDCAAAECLLSVRTYLLLRSSLEGGCACSSLIAIGVLEPARYALLPGSRAPSGERSKGREAGEHKEGTRHSL